MSKINDGGPAYPYKVVKESSAYGAPISTDVFSGMTLRDAAALQALNGMLAHSTRYRPRSGAPANWHDAICAEAFEIADAFIAARAKGCADGQ